MREKIIAGNWKMNKLPNETIAFFEEIIPFISNSKNEIVICVPYTDLFYALLSVQGTKIKIGAQNMHWEEKGAYTGEISQQMLKAIGVEYVIIGHSERRKHFSETDENVNKKIKAAHNVGLIPILCIGETLEDNEAGKTKEILINQIKLDLKDLTNDQIESTIIAYEPIWAIGTGKTATKEYANKTIKWIREELANIYGKESADKVIIQYGGSIKPENSKELFEMPDIDGGLVGGASLRAEEFAKIVNYDK